ncbi:MAG: hypothetical protein R8K21_02790 [Mariprofundales bacterium]
MNPIISGAKTLLLFLLVFVGSQPSYAFAAWEGETGAIELSGLLRATTGTMKNPNNQFFYERRNISGFAGATRLMLNANLGEQYSFEIHVAQAYIPMLLQTAGSRLANINGVERSDSLIWSFDNKQYQLLIDRINMQYTLERITIKAGRQPVNLAATFYFTPNDFFAPFSAQTFFRSYKAGVDALRADIQFGELSQLTIIGVLGYQASTVSDNGWSNNIEHKRNAYITRISSVFGDFEVAALGGILHQDQIIGGDIQGELFEWLGIRSEGHLRFPDKPQQKNSLELSFALEHRWENTLSLRLEQFYHGSGLNSVTAYNTVATSNTNTGAYLARNYSALGASYEFTPLLNGDATIIHNWIDNSSLLALYTTYSLSDESELAISGNIPMGNKPVGFNIRSEFGSAPYSLSMEARVYF